MKLPGTCCGVLNLRQGTFVIGLVLVGLSCMSVVGCVVSWVLLSAPTELHEPRVESVPSDGAPVSEGHGASSASVLPFIYGPYLALSLLQLLFSALLVYAARVERPCLLVTWLAYQGVVIVLGVIGAVVTFVLALHMDEYVLLSAVAGALGGTVIMAYFFVVVLAYHRQLQRPPATVVVRQPEAVHMVDIA